MPLAGHLLRVCPQWGLRRRRKRKQMLNKAAEALVGYRGNAPASAPQTSPLSHRSRDASSPGGRDLTPRAFRGISDSAETACPSPREKPHPSTARNKQNSRHQTLQDIPACRLMSAFLIFPYRSVNRITRSCITIISSRITVIYTGYSPTEIWLSIRPKRGGISVVPR